MNLENRKQMHDAAKNHLSGAENAAKIALIYACLVVGSSLLINGGRFFLGSQISQAGGLQNLGLKSVLSTLQTMLPIVFNFLLMCLGLGFTGAMLRITRDQFASPQSIKIGFARFWVLLRATLLEGGLYVLASFAAYFLSITIFFMTPLSRNVLKVMLPLVTGGEADIFAILENPAVMEQLISSMVPLYIIMGILFLILAAPVYYRYRLVNYLIIDEPRMGALMAMGISRMAMRRNLMKYLKLDLSMWWYYGANVIALIICYGSTILTLLGVELPLSPLVLSLGCFLVYLVLTFLITLFLQPHVEVIHAMAYEILRPRKQENSGGAVLGNIFDLAKDQMDQISDQNN